MQIIEAAVLESVGADQPYAKSKPLKIRSFELMPPGRDEVMVKIRAAGLCHSDLSVISGSRVRPTPMVLGHEAAGIVVGTGPGVEGFTTGDHVVIVFVPSCGHCVPCAEGRPALCEPAATANNEGSLLSGARRLYRNGAPVNHHLGVSAFAEYAVVSKHSVVSIDPALPFDHAALFGCAVITGVGAVLNTARVKAGSTVAVVGLGGVGMNAVLGARLAGARQIIAIDLKDKKLSLSKELGATETVKADNPECAAIVRSLSNGGVDCALEMVGSTSALELAWAITRRGGQTVTAGLPGPDARLSIPALQVVGEERTLRGSYLGSCVPVRDIPNYIDLHQKGLLPVEKLMGETLSLSDINAAFDRLAGGESTRQIILFDDD